MTTLEKIRIGAVRKILAKKNLPDDMRDYWASVLRRISDPWKQEKMWMENGLRPKRGLTSRSTKKDSK